MYLCNSCRVRNAGADSLISYFLVMTAMCAIWRTVASRGLFLFLYPFGFLIVAFAVSRYVTGRVTRARVKFVLLLFSHFENSSTFYIQPLGALLHQGICRSGISRARSSCCHLLVHRVRIRTYIRSGCIHFPTLICFINMLSR